MRHYLLKLIEKYKWMLNPHMDRHHAIYLLMKEAGLSECRWHIRRIMHVFVNGGRLIGLFNTHFKDELFETYLRVTVYEKQDTYDGKEQMLYFMAFSFFHKNEKGWPDLPNSVLETPLAPFSVIAEYVKMSKSLYISRGTVNRILEVSKKTLVKTT